MKNATSFVHNCVLVMSRILWRKWKWMKSSTEEQNMWHSWTCGIIGSSSIFDISLKNKKIIQGVRVDLRVLMPVIGVPESLRPAVHMLLEDPILDLVIRLHREGFSSSWSPLSGDSPLLKISKFPIKTLWACLSSPSSSPAVPNLDKTINPLHRQQQSCLLLKSMFPMMKRERGCLKTLKSHVFVKDIPALQNWKDLKLHNSPAAKFWISYKGRLPSIFWGWEENIQ